MIILERKGGFLSTQANWSAFKFGAAWDFIEGYWSITFTFGFWSLDISGIDKNDIKRNMEKNG